MSAGAYEGYRFFQHAGEIFGPGNRQGRRAAGGGDRGEIRRGGKGGGWNGFRAGRVAIRVERFGAARDGAPSAVISDHDEDRKLHYLRNMVADRRVGEKVRPVADGGNNQLFPARKLQPQRDGQGFAQAAGQRFLVIALGMGQSGKLRQRGQFRNDPAAVLISQMAEAVAEPGFGNGPGLAGMEKRVALVFLLLDAALRICRPLRHMLLAGGLQHVAPLPAG